ncbi:carboxypeptidase-like regulatory domain-containing protein [Dysgonomonas sp. Marseille-P4677]|uniref:VIT domain-containing protein n=1 Tax=Dysgonomonas sp. Marseille-P4677 TaxID=2364790 RepID=UPI001914CD4F|nr:VIT domain-containing protein [Dysgonomonas sp. Marseille-P4677]MBK5722758.1 carboxypeptidase-like regulatory domain-containing protein [Dysgonomonas sp. Marseille-P4677]
MKKIKRGILLICFFCYTIYSFSQKLYTPKPEGNTKQGVLSTLSIDVKIKEGIATTTLDMQFYQDGNQWQDEAVLQFSLTPNQFISQFMLDVNGKLRDASIVEKTKGRQAYEEIISRRVDPGLLEMNGENNYQLRVYPIMRRGYKRAVISYQEQLKKGTEGLHYHLPLGYNRPTAKISLNITVDGTEAPIIKESPLQSLQFMQTTSGFAASIDSIPLADNIFSVVVPNSNVRPQVFIEKGKYGQQRVFNLSISPTLPIVKKTLPRKVALYIDNSLSMQPLDNSLIELLTAYISHIGNLSVDLFSVNTEMKKIREFNIQNGDSKQLILDISRLKFDNSLYQELDFNKPEYDEIWFCSDGIINLGKPIEKIGQVPIIAINYNEQANSSLLNRAASASGGNYIDLTKTTTSEAIELLLDNPTNLISSEFDPKQITDIFHSRTQGLRINGTFTLTGILKSGKANIILNFGRGNTILKRDTITLNSSEAGKYDNFFERLWIHSKINELYSNHNYHLSEIEKLGIQYKMVTQNTSLIVLETIEDYVKYNIVPPTDKMQEEYYSMIQELKQDEINDIEKINEYVNSNFSRRKKLWKINGDEKALRKYEENIRKKEERSERWNEFKRRWQEGIEEGKAEQRAWEYRQQAIENGTYRRRYTRKRYSSDSKAYQKGTIIDSKATNTIKGIIRDEQGEPLIGCAIYINGTTNGTITNLDGEYELKIPPGKTKIKIAYIGYNSLEVDVLSTIVDVVLGEDNHVLEDVVVVGYTGSSSATEPASPPARERISKNVKKGTEGVEYYKWLDQDAWLSKMKSMNPSEIYNYYLSIKEEYEDIPFFYISIATLLSEKGLKDEAFKVVSNILELSYDNSLLIVPYAKFILQLGYTEQAIDVLEKNHILYSDNPMFYRELGLAYAQAGRYQEAVDILFNATQKEWNTNLGEEIQTVFLTDMNSIITKAKREKVKLKLGMIRSSLIFPLIADIRIVLGSYSKRNNLLLAVKDPNNLTSNSYYSYQKGGITSDTRAISYGPIDYLVRNGIKGTYNINVRTDSFNKNNNGLATLTYVEVYTNFGTEKEKKQVIFFQSTQDESNKEFNRKLSFINKNLSTLSE